MSGATGTAVAVAVLLGLPLAAVWLAGRWRDPPRERWGPSERDLAQAASDPALARHRRRAELGLAGDREWAAARRAVARGIPAPPGLRAAVRELAAERIAHLDAELDQPRASVLLRSAGLTAGVAGSLAWWAWSGSWLGVVVALYTAVLAIAQSRWFLRRRRDRAVAALAANV